MRYTQLSLYSYRLLAHLRPLVRSDHLEPPIVDIVVVGLRADAALGVQHRFSLVVWMELCDRPKVDLAVVHVALLRAVPAHE